MAGRLRRYTFLSVSVSCAVMFGVLSFAAVDLVAGLLPAGSEAASSAAMGDMAFGVIGLVLIAPAFASQLGRRRGAASLHQVALVVVALAMASVWSGEAMGVLGAAAVLVALVVVWVLHPDRGAVHPRPSQLSPSRQMFGLALVMSVPGWWYAGELAARGRADLPPENSFAFVPSLWSALVAVLVATSLLALLAASCESGWTVPAGCVAVAAFLFGLASVTNPDAPGSGGRGWGAAVIIWAGMWFLTAWVLRSATARRALEPPR